jgi:hypothetical protein
MKDLNLGTEMYEYSRLLWHSTFFRQQYIFNALKKSVIILYLLLTI